jgi:ribonuclease P protein component
LRKRAEYLTVQRRGRKVQGEHFLLLHLLSGDEVRVGVTVSTKVGGAVVRNRVKRWVREYVRRHRDALPPGDTVLVARASAATAVHEDIDRDLERILGKVRR